MRDSVAGKTVDTGSPVNAEPGRLSRIKKMAFTIIFALLCAALLELLSAAGLLIFYRGDKSGATLLSRFPAQLRMGADELARAAFENPKAGSRMMTPYSFDPVMGFRDMGSVTWVKRKTTKTNFTVCCLGGSTTAGRNWPVYLEQFAKKEGVTENIAVLNAGVPGYMSLNQHILLTSWVMGKNNMKCDAVVSMDGVNDIHFRVASYIEAKKHGDDWVPAYHAFHQKMERGVRGLMTPRGAFSHVISVFVSESAKPFAARVMPYTTRLIVDAAAGASKKRRYSAKKLVPPYMRDLKLNARSEFELPGGVEDEIVRAYRNSALDLAGAMKIRGVPFVSYLQPVNLSAYYNNPNMPHDAANAVPRQIASGMGGDFNIDVATIYKKTEGLYKELQISNPENFGSLITLFKPVQKDWWVYMDTVHYNETGSKYVAWAVVRDLVNRGILHRLPKR